MRILKIIFRWRETNQVIKSSLINLISDILVRRLKVTRKAANV